MVINWRTKTVTEISLDGHTIGSFSHDDLKEPIDLAIDQDGQVLVADNGVGAVLVFESSGKLLQTIGSRGTKQGQFKDLSAVTVAPKRRHHRCRLAPFKFSGPRESLSGKFIRKERARVATEVSLATAMGFWLPLGREKAKSFIQVFRLTGDQSGSLYSTIDSHGCKMKRPTGLAVMNDRHLVVVDIASDCVRKYRYF